MTKHQILYPLLGLALLACDIWIVKQQKDRKPNRVNRRSSRRRRGAAIGATAGLFDDLYVVDVDTDFLREVALSDTAAELRKAADK
jgi:hypothetical protein